MTVLPIVQLSGTPRYSGCIGKSNLVIIGNCIITLASHNSKSDRQLVRGIKPVVQFTLVQISAIIQHNIAGAVRCLNFPISNCVVFFRQIGKFRTRCTIRENDRKKDGHIMCAVLFPYSIAFVLRMTFIPVPLCGSIVLPAGIIALTASMRFKAIILNGNHFTFAAVTVHAAAIAHAGIRSRLSCSHIQTIRSQCSAEFSKRHIVAESRHKLRTRPILLVIYCRQGNNLRRVIVDTVCIVPSNTMLQIIAALPGEGIVPIGIAIGVNVILECLIDALGNRCIAVVVDFLHKCLYILNAIRTKHRD